MLKAYYSRSQRAVISTINGNRHDMEEVGLGLKFRNATLLMSFTVCSVLYSLPIGNVVSILIVEAS